MKNPEIHIIDNRMQWNMKRNGIAGVTLGWGMEPVICDTDGMVLPKQADKIINTEFYQNGDWPTCPITGQKLPTTDEDI